MRISLAIKQLTLVTSCSAVGLAAQGAVVDEGAFRLYQAGTEIGTETFAIRSTGSGDALQTLAAARLHLHRDGGSRAVIPRLLMVGPSHQFQGYQSRSSGEEETSFRLERDADRVVAHTNSEQGERMRELRFPENAVVLEPFVAHQFYFVGARIRAGATRFGVLPVGSGSAGIAAVSAPTSDDIPVGGTSVSASRYTVTLDDASWTVWFDADWRVLAVQSSSGFRAEREALP